MLNPRHALVATVATVLLVPAGSASASVDGAQTVRTLATDAATLLAEEAQLVDLADPARTTDAVELAEVRSQLRSVDGQGQSVLVQLQGLGVELTPAVRTTLDTLPPDIDTADGSVSLLPQPVVYDAAIDDLRRIAATPAAVAPVGGDERPSTALLFVAAGALLVLGIAALTNTLWRRPQTEELEAMAWSDGLTGLANRRRLDHDIDAGIEGPTSVIMIDVDYFKSINDAFGHQTGDEVLKRLGDLFSLQVRSGDVVYRYGGEEFCIILPGADEREARQVGDRIVESARGLRLPNGANVTVSIGIARSDGAELADAMEHADRALFIAKQRGRDRVVHADEHDLVGA